LDRAIEIARRAGRPLKVAAKIYPEERDYYAQVIEPLLHASRSFVEFLGEVGGRDKDEFLGNAYALLFPIDWAEPFGLVMIEALACGTPVTAWQCGSVPEVIADGVTGFVVDSLDQAVQAVDRLASLSRHACRTAFEERFDIARMAQDYLKVYRRLVHGGLDLMAPVLPAMPALALPAGHGTGRRKFSRAYAPLLGVVPSVRQDDRQPTPHLLHN
jgi:glycosyltransferase involved in cell wall biosynthesis